MKDENNLVFRTGLDSDNLSQTTKSTLIIFFIIIVVEL